jgi:hypothetical protein
MGFVNEAGRGVRAGEQYGNCGEAGIDVVCGG